MKKKRNKGEKLDGKTKKSPFSSTFHRCIVFEIGNGIDGLIFKYERIFHESKFYHGINFLCNLSFQIFLVFFFVVVPTLVIWCAIIGNCSSRHKKKEH